LEIAAIAFLLAETITASLFSTGFSSPVSFYPTTRTLGIVGFDVVLLLLFSAEGM